MSTITKPKCARGCIAATFEDYSEGICSTCENPFSTPKTVSLDEFDWSSMVPQYLLCRRHPNLRWITKHPWERNLHYKVTFSESGEYLRECPCPFSDLRVIVED